MIRHRSFFKAPRLTPGATTSPVPRAPNAQAASPEQIANIDIGRDPYSPMQPVQPFGPGFGITTPVNWDYMVGLNIDVAPAHLVVFQTLRLMAQTWGILQTIIQTRIDQFMRMPIAFQIRDKPRAQNKRIDEVRAFFQKPDGKTRWDPWCRMALWEMLTTDATAIYVGWRRADGKPYSVDIIDGAMIKPLIDDTGRRPDAPSPAYQQVRKGLPFVNLDEHELIYAPMRPRPMMPIYGYPPTEQIIVNIASGIARETYQAKFWREGTMPEMIMTVPESWNPQQVAQFQAMFDSLMAGNVQTKSRIRFVPSGMKPFDIKNANGEGLKADIDEWLTRIACFAYSVSPTPFIRQMNRATAQNAQEEAQQEGLHPMMTWWKSAIMDPLVQDPLIGFGYDDIEFVYKPEPQVDPLIQMQVITGYVKEGIKTRAEAREEINFEPMGGEAATLTVDTANGPVPLEETVVAARARAKAESVPDQIAQQAESHDASMQQMKSPAPPAVGKAAAGDFRQGGSSGSRAASAVHDGRCRCHDCLYLGAGAFAAGRPRRRAYAGYPVS